MSKLADGTVVLGLSHLVAELRSYPASARQAVVDALTGHIATAFPASTNHSDTPADEPVAPIAPANRLFLKANIFLFVEPWARAGRRRLYLNDEHGLTLGYKDLATDEVTTENEESAELARAVLQRAHPAGLGLVLDELPRISIDIPAGRLLGTLGRLWRSFLIAQHWRGHGKDRLYVTHALPSQGIFDLGHIDLRNRTLHPSSTQPLAKDLRTPQRYLELTLERYPRP